MTMEVLLSCMHQEKEEIAARIGIQTDACIVNQCDREEVREIPFGRHRIKWVDTRERGLSNSRNCAIRNAKGDICLLCDDDEVLDPDYENIILEAYRKRPEADILVFRLKDYPNRLPETKERLNRLDCLHVVSCQISFRREKIMESGIVFDPFMGAGSGNGAGEEVKFLLDAHKKGLSLYQHPAYIAQITAGESTWFSGFDKTFFTDRGSYTRYMLGLPLSVLYAVYYCVVKWPLYHKEISFCKAFLFTIQGILDNRIEKQKKKGITRT